MTSSGFSAKCFKVTTGNLSAIFDSCKYGPCGKSLCIFYNGNWITPVEFRASAIGTAADSYMWKRLLKLPDSKNMPVGKYLQEAGVSQCDRGGCQCNNCRIAVHHKMSKKAAKFSKASAVPSVKPLSVAVSPTPMEQKKGKDNDSDSGISNVSSTVSISNSRSAPPTWTGLTLVPEEKEKESYTLMVREAIVSISSGMPDAGCSRLGIMLHILTKYQPSEGIVVVNEKVKSALKLMARMGVVSKAGRNDNDSDLDDCGVDENLLGPGLADVKGVPRQIPKPETNVGQELKFKPAQFHKNSTSLKKKNKRDFVRTDAFGILKRAPENGATLQKHPKTLRKRGQKGLQAIGKHPMPAKLNVLSPALEAICGKTQMSRREVVSKTWQYIRRRMLQDPEQKTRILCDSKLKAMTRKKSLHQKELLGHISGNLSPLEP